MTEQERLDEILRMTERYKMDEARRRLSMVEASEMGPSAIDEYAYADQEQPPVQNAASMLPPESLSPRKIWPGSLEAGRRLGAVGGRLDADRPIPLPVPGQDFNMADLPPGYSVDETNTIRDNAGNVPRTTTPSFGDMASYLAGGMQPGGAVGMAAKAVAGTAHGADMVLGVGPTLRKGAKGAGGKPRGPEFPFPQYAESYPPVGPPKWELEPKKPEGGYWAKQLTPEAEAFAKERLRIQKDMDKNGFEPYFDPAKRDYVDPSNYPPNVDTLTVVPKKQATIDKDLLAIDTPEARARLQAGYAKGKELGPGAEHWYAMKQLEDEFIKELGPEAGRKAFADKFATSMAATTGGADPTANFLMSQYGNYLRHHDLPYPTAAHEMPTPIGGQYATGNMKMHKKIFDEGGYEALGVKNPKRHNFAQDYMGNRNAATIDEQMASGGWGIAVPPPDKYGLFEGVHNSEAAIAGVPPANFQDVTWAGFKAMKDKKKTYRPQPMIQDVNEAIERTHRLTGMPRDEIVRRGIVRSEIPIYSVGSSPADLMMRMREHYEREEREKREKR